jgi:F-type H+-transporting ATPase subunit epsilon
MEVYDNRQLTRVEDVCHFVGEDASGRFGLMAHHQRFMTALDIGLARFRHSGPDGDWEYLAFPAALLSFEHNLLTILTRRFWRHADFDQINRILSENLLREQQTSQALRLSLSRIEDNMLQRIWDLKRHQA